MNSILCAGLKQGNGDKRMGALIDALQINMKPAQKNQGSRSCPDFLCVLNEGLCG